jgi:hypothetical protein
LRRTRSTTATATCPAIANLLTPDPKEVMFHSSAVGRRVIQVDLGSSQLIDSFFFGYLSYPSPARSIQITGGSPAPTALEHPLQRIALCAVGRGSPLRQHLFVKLSVAGEQPLHPVRHQQGRGECDPRHRRWSVFPSSPPITANGAAAARSSIPASKDPLLGGGFGIGEGARKAGYRWTFGDLSDAEIDRLYDLALDRGETRPVVAVEDPDFKRPG